MPTSLPLVLRRCHVCASGRFRADGKFRVNANHKLLDAGLLVRCTSCGDTVKLTVLERMNVRSIRPELLNRLHHNDLGLAAELLQDPFVRHRNRITLDWDDAWRLDTGAPDHPSHRADPDHPDHEDRPDHPSHEADPDHPSHEDHRDHPDHEADPDHHVIDVSVRFAARIPVRPVRLIAEGCDLSRAEVERLIAAGKLVSATRLNGKLSSDFTFTLKR